MEQIGADIQRNSSQSLWEPWKAMIGVPGAAAAIFTELGILIGSLLSGNIH